MSYRPPRQLWLPIVGIILPVFLSACASTPRAVPGQCPKFPQVPPELMQPPPTLYLLPHNQQTTPPVKN